MQCTTHSWPPSNLILDEMYLPLALVEDASFPLTVLKDFDVVNRVGKPSSFELWLAHEAPRARAVSDIILVLVSLN